LKLLRDGEKENDKFKKKHCFCRFEKGKRIDRPGGAEAFVPLKTLFSGKQ